MTRRPQKADSERKSMLAELEQYRHHLDGADMTEARKTELLETLWVLINEIMSEAFGTHPVQAALEARAKRDKTDRE